MLKIYLNSKMPHFTWRAFFITFALAPLLAFPVNIALAVPLTIIDLITAPLHHFSQNEFGMFALIPSFIGAYFVFPLEYIIIGGTTALSLIKLLKGQRLVVWFIIFSIAPLVEFIIIDFIFSAYRSELKDAAINIVGSENTYLYSNARMFLELLEHEDKLLAWIHAIPISIAGVWLYHFLLKRKTRLET